MTRRIDKQWLVLLVLIVVAAIVMDCCKRSLTDRMETPNKFEMVRAHIQTWLSETSVEDHLIWPSCLQDSILDHWNIQQNKYQIVSVRTANDYNNAGHIPKATNIYWIGIVDADNLTRLDANKILILYCYYGHGSMLSSTILNLLGYRCRSLNFGMMGWNLDALVKEPWDQKADYEVETAVNRANPSYPPPAFSSDKSDAVGIIMERATQYLSGEGSPVILSSDVKAIIDDWDDKKAEYQIVDVRSKRDYETGHIPHSIHIPWSDIAETKNLQKLDANRTTIVYSENGQTGQLATTVLNLLGYHAVEVKFGMMDWNDQSVDRSQLWAGAAGYPIEFSPQSPEAQ